MIPPSGKTCVKTIYVPSNDSSERGGGPDFDYRQSPVFFFLRCLSLDDDDEALKRSRTSSCVSHSSLSFREILSFFTRAAEEVDAHNSHSRDTRFRARIANTRGDHGRQPKNKYFYPKDIRSRARISNTRGDHDRER